MSTGKFVWYDLMTSDVPAARAFYAALFDWKIEQHSPEYTMISHGEHGMGGMASPPAGVPSHWTAYVSVGDIHASLAKTLELGGRVLMQPITIPRTGQFAVIMDPYGASISLIQLEAMETPWTAPKGENAIGWAELHTSNPEGALAFYQGLFGWESQSWDMGEGGTYYLVGSDHNGGIMRGQPGMPSHWLLYANVASTDATVAKTKDLGGKVYHGPQDLKGVGRFAILADPTGAVFAIMQSRRDG